MHFTRAAAVAAMAALCFQETASAPASFDDAASTCGALGVMKVDKDSLPPSVKPDNVRKCLNHPESLSRGNEGGEIFRRQCWPGGEYGCSNGGYCWTQCAGPSGEWCWAAEEEGFGPWIRCSKWQDCDASMACGQGKVCDSCGCSC
ncbi:uncharacterized protein MAM_02681 [Metarhizium album ARSEF 1941]|uniref:IDI-2 n=1 Tax=Metarhizium album (strain ARSEF 1941) TaxID=1081103 RepID=A0A0B2X0L6_METAS|nr:uncharacterized protein MAM_02681 [Metarhizium album ARSEF 1941]KHN99828.1 hypothetical protein MAM_02681 [Metarhizium album ARSEF 1941]